MLGNYANPHFHFCLQIHGRHVIVCVLMLVGVRFRCLIGIFRAAPVPAHRRADSRDHYDHHDISRYFEKIMAQNVLEVLKMWRSDQRPGKGKDIIFREHKCTYLLVLLL